MVATFDQNLWATLRGEAQGMIQGAGGRSYTDEEVDAMSDDYNKEIDELLDECSDKDRRIEELEYELDRLQNKLDELETDDEE